MFSSVGWLLGTCFLLYVTLFLYLTNLPIQNPLHLGVLLRFFMQVQPLFSLFSLPLFLFTFLTSLLPLSLSLLLQPNAIVCVWVGLGYAYLESLLISRGLSRTIPLLFVLFLSSSQVLLNFSTMVCSPSLTLLSHYISLALLDLSALSFSLPLFTLLFLHTCRTNTKTTYSTNMEWHSSNLSLKTPFYLLAAIYKQTFLITYRYLFSLPSPLYLSPRSIPPPSFSLLFPLLLLSLPSCCISA